MLGPEVCDFPSPKVNVDIDYCKTSASVADSINKNCFYHNITVICPNLLAIPDTIADKIFIDNDYYKLIKLPICELIEYQFIKNFVHEGSVVCISLNRRSDVEDCVSLTSAGFLELYLNEQSFQELGIDGGKPVSKSYRKYTEYYLFNWKMPSIKQPKRLEDLALHGLGDWIALQAEELMTPISTMSQKDSEGARLMLSNKVKQIRMLLEYNIPWLLFNQIGEEVFRSIYELLEKTKQSLGFRGSMAKFVQRMNVAVTMTEVLLTRHLTTLTIDAIPKMVRSVFYTKLSMLTGLRYLNLGSLSGGWKTIDMEPGIIDATKTLYNLRFLCINYDCTDRILRSLLLNCPRLESLDLSCSKNITNDSVNIIMKLPNINSVQLYRTSVTLEGFAKLLLNAKQLRDIGRCDEIGKVLEYIDTTSSSAGPFQLTSYVSRYAPLSHIQLAVDLCPHIQKLTIFHNSLQGELTVLIGLPELSELKLLSCDFYGDQIKQILQVKGCNISSLHLEHVDQIDLNALMYISQMCPMLNSLTLYNCVLIQHTSLFTTKLEVLPFRNIRNLTCVCECTDQQLKFILQNCLNVKFIHLGTAVQLTDQLIEEILEKNPFVQLEELRIMQSDFMTMATIDRLLNTCLNLHVFVELECWSLITESDREHIRNYIKTNNLNVDITPIRRYDV